MPPKPKARPKMRPRGKFKMPTWGWVVIIAGVIGFSVWLSTLAIAPAGGDEDEGTGITVTLNNIDSMTDGNVTDAINTIYDSDELDDIDETIINALVYGNFTEMPATNGSGDAFDWEASHVYVVYSEATGYNPCWTFIEHSGEFDILMTPIATNVSIVALSETLKTNLCDNAVSNTTETEWHIVTQTMDSEGAVNDSCGFTPYLNFTEGTFTIEDLETPVYSNFVMLGFFFVNASGPANGTYVSSANSSWIVEIEGMTEGVDYDIMNITYHLYVMFYVAFDGLDMVHFTFDDGIGTVFNIGRVEFLYGTDHSADLYNWLT